MRTRTFLFWPILIITLTVAALASAGTDSCPCDCNSDGRVAVAELVLATSISLDDTRLSYCNAADRNTNGKVEVNELIGGVGAALHGCDGAPPTPTPSPQLPPTDANALLAWLQDGNYLGWTAESAPHASGGPHFGNVRTFVNDALFDSLAAGDEAHPMGAAAVKELYGGTGDDVRGWAVSVKTAPNSNGGQNWYWLEQYNGGSPLVGQGLGICTGCHGQDYRTFTSKDLVLIPFPLQ